jgi:muramoyltetrapeptide carboxypeptidase
MHQIPPLQPGNTVAIVAPARKIMPEEISDAVRMLREWGLQVQVGESVGAAHRYFAGDDALRLADLQRVLDDPAVKAVICARGGYGTTRILDSLDFTSFRRHPKWVVGFSDITALHCHLHQMGYESLHGEMPLHFGMARYEEAVESLRHALFGGQPSYRVLPHPLNQLGSASGQLIGGNLSIIHTVIGTQSDPDTRGKILFLEDIGEYLYHLDRMLVHLHRAGKLAPLAGLVVGHMTDIKENIYPFGVEAYEIIRSHTASFGYPVCFGFPVGHEPANMALICGRKVKLDVTEEGSLLRFEDWEESLLTGKDY